MTSIKTGSPVVRETANTYRGRPIIVELYPGYMVLRVKGLKSMKHMLPYDTALERAAMSAATQEIRAQKADKKRKVNRGLLQFVESQ